MQDWASFFQQSTHATVEISSSKWPQASTLPQYWAENKESLVKFLENGATGVHLYVTNAANEPLEVSVDLGSAKRTLKYNGYVHRPTVQGTQQVTLSAPGYNVKHLSVSPRYFDGIYENVILEKN